MNHYEHKAFLIIFRTISLPIKYFYDYANSREDIKAEKLM